MSKRCKYLLLLLAAGGLWPLGPLEAQPSDRRADSIAAERLDVRRADVVSEVPGARPELQSIKEVMERMNVREAAALDGSVFAISPDRTNVTRVDDLDQALAPGSLILNTVRNGARVMRPPESLESPEVSGETYALSWELITPGGRFRAWGRNSTGLSFDGASGDYVGSFDVALTYLPDQRDPPPLDPPISVSIAAPNAERISPAPLKIDTVNQWHSVNIAVRNLQQNDYAVSISANPSDEGDRIEMPVSRPRIDLSANPAEPIDGWGIGKTTITVHAQGIKNPAGYEVTLASTAGTLNPTSVVLDAQGRGEAYLRSSRANAADVSVRNTGSFTTSDLRVKFAQPWLFLGLAVLGGVLGAILQRKGRKHWFKGLAIGAVTGVVMALLYAVGINWLGNVFPSADLAVGGEALVVVLGATGALVGIRFAIPNTDSEG
ncbi:MAG: hypothetical protein AAFX56_07325 [Pseudomonadota bacterium]